MLLEDLIDTKIKNIKIKDYFGKINTNDDLGRGTISNVSQHKNDPHMVVKRSATPVVNDDNETTIVNFRKDSFRDYAEFIIKNKLADKNPWFPRIYVMKDFEDKGNMHLHKYEMEKLERFTSLSHKQLFDIFERLFPEYDLAVEYDFPEKEIEHYFFAAKLEQYFIGEFDPDLTTPDETLKDACIALTAFQKEYNVTCDDMGPNNFLIRRGKYGLQLVINDPIY